MFWVLVLTATNHCATLHSLLGFPRPQSPLTYGEGVEQVSTKLLWAVTAQYFVRKSKKGTDMGLGGRGELGSRACLSCLQAWKMGL